MNPVPFFLVMALLFGCSAFFSAAETAFISLGSYHKLKGDGEEKTADPLAFWFHNPAGVLTTVLIANNAVNIGASVLAASFSYRYFQKINISLITGIMTFFLLLFGEIIPKSLAKRSPERFARITAVPLNIFCTFFSPVTRIFLFFANLVIRLFGGKPGSLLPLLTEDDLKAMISAGEEDGAIEKDEREMIHSIFELGDTQVREIMVPRVNVAAVRHDAAAEEILREIVEGGFSRLPVYERNLDRIIGLIYVKDLLALQVQKGDAWKLMTARDVMRGAHFVPETKKVQDLMRELQAAKLQMAVVVDEYGGTAGIVTMEDVIEEIVGDISDEYRKDVPPYQRLPDGTLLVRGSMEIEKANEDLGLDLPEGEVETVAGFLLDRWGRCPKKGERFVHGEYQYAIHEADHKTVTWVRVKHQ